MSPQAFVEASSLPIVPVTLHFDETRSKWRKQPRISWELATTEPDTITGWWERWPDALPGIPLARVGLAVVDGDGADGVAEVTNIGCLGPHSRITTVNGGVHLVFAQPPESVSRFRWSANVEVLGTSSLLTCYDLEEMLFPRVAPRAKLPKMFWQARDDGDQGFGSKGNPRIKTREAAKVSAQTSAVTEVADLTAALWEMDATDWRGDYDGWFHLAGACQAVGIPKVEFVRWSASDPVYAADGRMVERIWDSAAARHGGALWKALAERGITIGRRPSLYPRVPLEPSRRVEEKVLEVSEK